MYMGPFGADAGTIAIAVTATASASVSLPGVGSSVRIINTGAAAGASGSAQAFVSIGPGTQTATLPSGTVSTSSTPVISGDTSFTIPQSSVPLQISAICLAAGSTTLYVQVSEGF